mmetsp:Transcript_13371/g.40300  ORF Transcript_13371/g.40300 Transcript_13371/m.40300 type:complete len:212 (+) Transcript_13371:954-1589(+)
MAMRLRASWPWMGPVCTPMRFPHAQGSGQSTSPTSTAGRRSGDWLTRTPHERAIVRGMCASASTTSSSTTWMEVCSLEHAALSLRTGRQAPSCRARYLMSPCTLSSTWMCPRAGGGLTATRACATAAATARMSDALRALSGTLWPTEPSTLERGCAICANSSLTPRTRLTTCASTSARERLQWGATLASVPQPNSSQTTLRTTCLRAPTSL